MQDHARTILPHLTVLAGNEGADAWIRETMNIFNASLREACGGQPRVFRMDAFMLSLEHVVLN